MRTIELGGRRVRFVHASPALVPVTESFAHLAADPAGPVDLEVRLWDSESSGIAGPEALTRERGTAAGITPRRVFRDDDAVVVHHFKECTASVFRPRARTATWWARHGSAHDIPWEHAAPLRDILTLWAPTVGWRMVHAGAVGDDTGAALIVGPGGAGKSTLALACFIAGMSLVGDDYVLARTTPEPTVASVSSHSKVITANLVANLPELATNVVGELLVRAGPKSVLALGGDPARLAREVPLRAIVAPRIVEDARSTLTAASPARVLLRLAPSTVFQAPGDGEGGLAAMAELVRSVPTYELAVGRDRASAVDAMRRAIVGDVR